MVTIILIEPKVVKPTNSCMFAGPHRLVGTYKTADFTQTPRGHRTGCPPEKRRPGEGFGIVLSGFGKGVRGVNDSLPQSMWWSIRISVAPGILLDQRGEMCLPQSTIFHYQTHIRLNCFVCTLECNAEVQY